MRGFQGIVIIIFIIFAAGGVILFATFRDSNNVSDIDITIWGQEPTIDFNNFLGEFNKNTGRSFGVTYKEITKEDFVGEVVEAIAVGEGPDIIILSSDDLLEFEDKIYPVPYESLSERSFRDIFIEGGEIFLSPQGVLALPFSVDPLVTYWNRDILQSYGIANPPTSWNELFSFAEKLTQKDEALNIKRSAVALGEYSNIKNAKEIILSLILQSGNPVISRSSGSPRVVITNNLEGADSSAESAIRFYTEFSNPTKTSYSWNKALSNSQDEFVSGDLALYFGKASELTEIRKRNPNLNFDVSLFPQISDSNTKEIIGEMKGLAILRSSSNLSTALAVIGGLIGGENILAFSNIKKLPPVRRDLLNQPPGLAFEDLFYRSALITKVFLDPDPEETDVIFNNLINRIVSGRNRINEALSRTSTELNSLLVDN